MYRVDGNDRVVPLTGIPQSSTGAPLPVVIASDWRVFLAYLVEALDPAWDGRTVRVVNPGAAEELVSVVRFIGARAHYSGAPNDEAFAGHPLASRGLRPYGAFEIQHSSWIRQLAEMNSVHPQHDPRRFARLRHFVFAFHDSVFECVAEDMEIEVREGSITTISTELAGRLFEMPDAP